AFALKGLRMVGSDWPVGLVALTLALVFRASRVLPSMFLLLALGVGVSLWQTPGLLGDLAAVRPTPQLPPLGTQGLTWDAVAVGALLLALPQLPLTLGNAILAVTAEHNRLFPARRIGHRRVALSTGLMNLLSPLVGGIPLCHGAGGLAAHVRFGARTGGAPVIVGSLLLALALLFGDAVGLMLGLFPDAVLGVMLLLAGLALARSALRHRGRPGEGLVLVATAATAIWSVGAAFVVGMVLNALVRWRQGRDGG
ncbi:MAG: putative sulfate/molybdate transporter, partial [Chromatiales bacterium]